VASPLVNELTSKEIHLRVPIFEAPLLLLGTRFKHHYILEIIVLQISSSIDDIDLSKFHLALCFQINEISLPAIEVKLAVLAKNSKQMIIYYEGTVVKPFRAQSWQTRNLKAKLMRQWVKFKVNELAKGHLGATSDYQIVFFVDCQCEI
jgi:hypothetical protein